MLTTLITAVAAITFPGGDVSDLAKSIAEATKQNVVFQAGATENSRAFDYDVADLNEMAKAILAGSGFKRAPGAEHVFHHGRLGSWAFGLPAVQSAVNDETWRSGVQWPADAVQDGKVTIHAAPGQAFSIDSIPKEFLPKTLEVHWYFQGLALKPWVTGLPAQDFINYVAKAVGGKLLQKTDRFILEVDGTEVQRRAIATLAEVQKTPKFAQMSPHDKARLELTRTVLAGLSGPQVTALLSTPQGTLRFEIGPTTRPAVQAYAQALSQMETLAGSQVQEEQVVVQQGRRGQRGQNRPNNIAMLLRRADPRVLGYTTIDAKFNVRVELLTLDNFGRPGRLVALP